MGGDGPLWQPGMTPDGKPVAGSDLFRPPGAPAASEIDFFSSPMMAASEPPRASGPQSGAHTVIDLSDSGSAGGARGGDRRPDPLPRRPRPGDGGAAQPASGAAAAGLSQLTPPAGVGMAGVPDAWTGAPVSPPVAPPPATFPGGRDPQLPRRPRPEPAPEPVPMPPPPVALPPMPLAPPPAYPDPATGGFAAPGTQLPRRPVRPEPPATPTAMPAAPPVLPTGPPSVPVPVAPVAPVPAVPPLPDLPDAGAPVPFPEPDFGGRQGRGKGRGKGIKGPGLKGRSTRFTGEIEPPERMPDLFPTSFADVPDPIGADLQGPDDEPADEAFPVVPPPVAEPPRSRGGGRKGKPGRGKWNRKGRKGGDGFAEIEPQGELPDDAFLGADLGADPHDPLGPAATGPLPTGPGAPSGPGRFAAGPAPNAPAPRPRDEPDPHDPLSLPTPAEPRTGPRLAPRTAPRGLPVVDPAAADPYGQDAYAQDPYGQPGYDQAGYDQTGYPQPQQQGYDGYGQDPDPYAQDGAEPFADEDRAAAVAVQDHGRAGRNLPAAIGVGVGLGALALAGLFTKPQIFVAIESVVIVLAVWELSQALAAKHFVVPVIPLAVGSLGMLVSAFVAGEEGLLVSFMLTGFGILLWRIIDDLDGAVGDVAAGLFTAAYVPFLGGFAILLLAERRRPAARRRLHRRHDRERHRRLRRRRPVRPAPDGAHGQPEEVLGGLRRVRRGLPDRRRARRHAAAGGPLVRGRGPRRRGRRHGDPRRPGGVAAQARPRREGHGQPAARPRRDHGPPGLAAPDGPGGVRAAHAARAGRRPLTSPGVGRSEGSARQGDTPAIGAITECRDAEVQSAPDGARLPCGAGPADVHRAAAREAAAAPRRPLPGRAAGRRGGPRGAGVPRQAALGALLRAAVRRPARRPRAAHRPARPRPRPARGGAAAAAVEPVRRLECDGGTTVKTVWRLFDGALVESVLMRYPDRTTVCVSSQAGCGMNCPFCATGQAGLTRNLSTAEIVEQVVAAGRALARDEVPGGDGPRRATSSSWAWASRWRTTAR